MGLGMKVPSPKTLNAEKVDFWGPGFRVGMLRLHLKVL